MNQPTILLVGGSGTGKTYSIRTLLDIGVTPFILCTEPGIESVLGDLPPDKCHWHYVAPGAASWTDLISASKKVNTLSNDALQKLAGIDKTKYQQFIEILSACNNFTCDRTGESFGDVMTWGPERAFVLDSLSGLSIAAMNLAVGTKPVRTQPDWGTAMNNLEQFITTLSTAIPCWTVLIAHLEREKDEISGAVQLMPSTLGQKLSPKIGRFFDDTIHCIREGKDFRWSTITSNVDLKARNLPLSDKIPPSFRQIQLARDAKANVYSSQHHLMRGNHDHNN